MTIRMAYAIGLHCHPKYLEPAPPTQTELATRQKIWWYMLRIDEEYSMTFGRPLGISSIGTCCWPQELTTDPIVRRFGEFMAQFTVLARQILSSDRLINLRIDELTDALRRLLDTIPEILQFNAAWNRPENTSSHELWPLMNMAAGQQAFNSCMLLVSDAIEHCRITDGALKVEQSLVIFKELGENNVHRLAQYATEKISSCLKTLYDIVAQSPHNKSEARSRQEKRTAIPGSRKSEATQALATVGNVMGHTGMQLLEDCGLQASVQEAFAPMNWNTAGLLTDHSNEHEIQRENTKIGEKNALKPGSHRQGTLNFEPTDAVQATRLHRPRFSQRSRGAK
ncbi:hypothetical protein ACJBU6_00786 [Exserohilum turcicum]